MNQKIKVVYVVNDLMVGGAQTIILGMCQNIDREKFEPVVVYLYDFENLKVTLKKKFEEENVKLICLEKLCNSKKFLKLISTCAEILKSEKPNLVHIHLPNSLIVGGVASILTNTKFIINEDNTHQFHSWKIKLVFLLLRPFAKLTICYAETVEKEVFGTSTVLTKPEEFTNQKIITIMSGINVDKMQTVKQEFSKGGEKYLEKRKSLGIEDKDIVVFSAARFVKWKGHHLLVEAFMKLLNHRPPGVNAQFPGPKRGPVVLVIAGEGPEKVNIEKTINESNLQNKIKLIGARNDINELLAISDIYSLVFDYEKNMINAEAIGVAGFEGMAAGLPTVIGNFGGANFYMKNWENGVIVKPWDIDDQSNAILKLAEDSGLRNKIGENAVIRVREILDWKAIVKIYESIYCKLK